MSKHNSVKLLTVILGCSFIVACNGGHNSTSPTTSNYQTQPLSSYKNTLQNLSGEQLSKLVVVDAKFQPLKTIDNFNCQKDYLCGIKDSDLQNAAGFEFYNQSGHLVSATLIRKDSNNFYADDLHLGAYLMEKAKANGRSDITSLDRDSLDQLEILGRDYRLYLQVSTNDTMQAAEVKKILLDTKGMKLTKTTLMSNSKSLQGSFGEGNSACLETAKQMGAVGELGGMITKVTDAQGMKNSWFEALGGVAKTVGAFTNAGCDISSQTMSMLNEISYKLDQVIQKQDKTITLIKGLDHKIDVSSLMDTLKAMDNNFNKLYISNEKYKRFLGYENDSGKPMLILGRKLENLNDYVTYVGGFDNAMKNGEFEDIFTTLIGEMKSQLITVTKKDAMTSDLPSLWSYSATICKPGAIGSNLVANLALCNYGASQVINNYLPQVIMSEQILTSIESFIQTTNDTNHGAYESLNKLMRNKPDINYVKTTYTLPYATAITEHYKNLNNWYITVNGEALDWLKFIDQIINEGESQKLACSVDDVTKTEGEGGVTARVHCIESHVSDTFITPIAKPDNTKNIVDQTLTNIQKSYGKYEYVTTYATLNDGITPDMEHKEFVPDRPIGEWRNSCDWENSSLIGPREPLYNNKRMILKTKCKKNRDYSYVDLKAIPKSSGYGSMYGTSHDYRLSVYSGNNLAHSNTKIMDHGSDFIPIGNYLDYCVTEHIRTYQKDGKTYAHQIMSCWDEYTRNAAPSYKMISHVTQHEVSYVLDNQNPVNKIMCNIDSAYHTTLSCTDKYSSINPGNGIMTQVDSHQLLSYGKIANTYDYDRTIDHNNHYYHHLGAQTWFDLGDDHLGTVFKSIGDFYTFSDDWTLSVDGYVNYARFYQGMKNYDSKTDSYIKTAGYTKFWNEVEEVEDIKMESDVRKSEVKK